MPSYAIRFLVFLYNSTLFFHISPTLICNHSFFKFVLLYCRFFFLGLPGFILFNFELHLCPLCEGIHHPLILLHQHILSSSSIAPNFGSNIVHHWNFLSLMPSAPFENAVEAQPFHYSKPEEEVKQEVNEEEGADSPSNPLTQLQSHMYHQYQPRHHTG